MVNFYSSVSSRLRFGLIGLLILFSFLAKGQSTIYTDVNLVVNVSITNPCGASGNGAIRFTINQTGDNQPATLNIITGPKNLFSSQVIPVGGSYTFNSSGTGLPAGSYNFVISDFTGTHAINTFSLGTPLTLVALTTPTINEITRTNNSDCAAPDGQVVASVSGGSVSPALSGPGSFTYSWSTSNALTGFPVAGTYDGTGNLNLATLLGLPGLPGGTYTLSITDNYSACSPATRSFTITDPSPALQSITSGSGTVCSGTSFTVTLSGSESGGTIYEIIKNGTATGITFAGTGASPFNMAVPTGTFSNGDVITVIAKNGACSPRTMSGSVVINLNPSPTSATLSGTTVICAGLSTDLSVAITGGTAPFSFTIIGYGPVTNYASGTAIAVSPPTDTNYTLTGNVTDANGCFVAGTGTAAITVIPKPTITLTPIVPFCEGPTTADLGYTATTGSPTQYRIDWDLTANLAGVSDVALTALPASPIVISGLPATVTSTTTFNGTLFVRNTSGCEDIPGTTISVTISPIPTITLGTINPVCFGTNGSLPYSATTGAPTQYRIDWDGTANGAGLADVGLTALPGSAIPISALPNVTVPTTFDGTLFVSNAGNCESTPGQSISITVNPVPVPPSVTFTPVTYCVGDPLTTAPVVDTPVGTSTYTWYSNAALTTVLTTGTSPTNAQLGFSTASANVTTVYVTETNASNCESPATAITLTVTALPLAPAVTFTSTYCEGKPITPPVITAPVGTSTYTWYSDAALTTVLTTGTTPTNAQLGFSSAAVNTTTVYVTETAGSCQSPATTVTLTVNPTPVAPSVTFTPTTYCAGDPLATSPVVDTPVGTSTYTWYSDVALTTVLTTSATPTNAQLGFSTATANITTVYVTEKNASSCESVATAITLTVTALPTAPSVTFTPATYCVGDALTTSPAITTPVGTSTYTWYSDAALTTILTTGTTPTNAQLGFSTATANTTTVYVTETAGSCKSPATVVTITVSPAPAAPSVTFTPTTYCVGDALPTSPAITTPVGTSTYTWYSDAALTTILTTGTTPTNAQLGFSTAAVNSTTVYVTEKAGSCESPAAIVTITVSPTPVAPLVTFTPTTYCVGDALPASPAITTPVGTNTYTWYSDVALTTVLTTGATPTNVQLGFSTATANTTTVYVTEKAGSCESPATAVTLTVSPAPTAPVVTFTPATYCVGDPISTSPVVNTPVGTSTYTWYSDVALTTVLITGTAPTNAQLGFSSAVANTTTVYVTQKAGTCESLATAVTLTVDSPVAPAVTFAPSAYCVGDPINAPAISTPVGTSTYTWYSDVALTTVLTTGTTPTNAQLGFSSAAVNTTTVYVTEKAGSCESPATTITLTVGTTPSAPSVTFSPSAYCVGQTITASPAVTTPVGTSTYTWYSDVALTTVLITGATPTNVQLGFSSAIANTTTVYVTEKIGSCESPATPVTLTVDSPVAPSVTFTPTTYCVGDPLTASPVVDTPVGTSIYTWYSNSGLTTILTTGTAPTNAQLGFSTTTANATTVYVTETNASSCESLVTMVTITVTALPTAPSVTFTPATYCVGDAISTSPTVDTPVGTSTYTWYSDVALTTILTTGTAPSNVQLGFSSAATNTTTVYVTEKAGSCESPATAVTLTVSPTPTTAPSVTFTPATYCVGETIATSPVVDTPVGTSTYTWYSDVALTTVLITGTTPTNAQLGFSSATANTTTVYVTEKAGACESPATAVTFTVNSPAAPSVTFTPAAYCVGDAISTSPIVDTPVGTSTYTWYSDAALTTILTTGATPTNAQLGFSSAAVNTTTVYVTEKVGSCESTATLVTLTVTALPTAPSVTFTPTTYCEGKPITASPVVDIPVGTSTYTWYSDAALTTVLITGATPTNAQLGFSSATANTTTVYVTESAGSCEGPATAVTLTVNPAPAAPAVTFDPTPVCIGSAISAPVITTPVGTSTYTWYSDAALTTILTTGTAPTNAQLNFSSAAANVTTVYVAETGINGCEGLATAVTLSVSDIPTASISGTTTVCAGVPTTITLNLTGIQPWDVVYTDGTTSFPLNGITTSTFTFPVSPLTTTSYSLVSVSNTACGAGTVSGSANIIVKPIAGDPLVSGTDTWIGYVYTDAGAAAPPVSNINYASSKYRGYIDETDIPGFGASSYNAATDAFDLNFGNATPLAGPNVCGSYLDDFSIRFRMTKPFTAGGYTFTIGADDGARLFIDGIAVTLAPNGSFTTHAYATYSSSLQCITAGNHDVVVEYFERGGLSRVTFNYTQLPIPAVDTIAPISACVNQATAPTLTANSTTPGVTVTGYNWYTDAALLTKVATTAAYTPSAAELDLTTANTTTFYATATYACGEGPATAVVVNVINSVNTALTVAPTIDPVCSGGTSGIKITASEAGVTYQLRNDADNSLVGTAVTSAGGDITLPTDVLTATTTFNVFASAGTCSGVLATKPTVNVSGTVNAGLTVTPLSSSVCTGTSTDIQIFNSESGVTYQLRNDADDSLIDTPVAGTGLAAPIALPTGNLSTLPSVTFNILASNGTCSIELSTLATVVVDINPNASLAVDSDVTGNLCVGGAANITVNNSEVGVSYQLRDDSNDSPVGSAVAGDGTKINLPTGVLNATTTFNVLATSGACTPVELTATKTIAVSGAVALNLSVTPLDAAVCSGSATVINISNSEAGVTYQLRNDADDSLIGAAVAGTGSTTVPLSLPTGNLTTLPSITFNILASSVTCSAELSNKATVTVGTNPDATLAVTVPPATLCVNGATSVTVVGSETGVSYQLRNDADDSLIGTAVAGIGGDILLPTGNLAATITFNVLASSGACTQVELNATVTVNVSGTIASNLGVTANASPICSGAATTINVANSDPTVTYQLRDNATNALIGTALAGNGATLSLPTGNLTANTVFNVLASNGTCSVQLTTTASITVTTITAGLGVSAQNAAVCATNTGTNIQIVDTQVGVTYQLRDNSNNSLIGSAVAGTGPGTTLNLPTGILAASTVYNVFATLGTCSVQLTTTVSVTVRAATDPLCIGGGTGNCATVVITPVPTPAQCTLSNGAINFTINPAVPLVNNTGVKITITGISTTNSTIARTNFNNPSFPALPIGVYTYSIEYGDASCLKTGQVTIDQSGTVGTPVASNVVGPKCAGSTTGAVTLNVPGETGNVLEWSLDGVLWNSFTAGNQITGIPAGAAPSFQRVLSVRRNSTDPCNAGVTITIQDQFTPITATITSQTAATCNNNDGSVLAAYSGGDNTAYTFELDGSPFTMPTDKIIRNLSGGNHILKVIDNQLCSITLSGTQFAVASPGLIQFNNVTVANPSCIGNGEDGMITVEFPTGSNEVAITQDADRSSPVFKDVAVNGVVEYKNLSKGRYYVTVKSKVNGCPNERAIDILGGPSRISFTQEMTCELGNPVLKLSDINVDAASGSFDIQIVKLGDTTPNVITLTGIPAGGIYYIKGSELPSVTGDYEIKLVQVQGACTISSVVSRYTNRGSLTVNAANILPSYSDIATGAFNLTNFAGGTVPYYTSIRFDSASNPVNEVGFETDMEEVDSDPSTFGYIKKYNKLHAGRYHVTVNEEGGCSVEFDVRVPIDYSFKIENIPNVFTPNGDGVNDFFFVRNLPAGSQLIISNRWGNEMYSSKSYQNDWNGGSAADGIYYYRLKVEGESAVTGWIEIQRGK